MKITPLDIRHKEFKRGLRGYADAEVDEFLDMVADEYERLFKENMDLTERVEALSEKVAGYKRIEDALQKTLVSAQASAEEVKQNAAKTAQLMLHEAELKARQLMNSSYTERQAVEQATAKLRSAEQEFRFKFRQMLQSYLKQAEEAPTAQQQPAETSSAQADLARHAEAIREAISREETKMPPGEPAENAPSSTSPEAAAGTPTVTEPQEEAPAAPEPGKPAVEGNRILFGERDDLLADVDSGVSENEFKW